MRLQWLQLTNFRQFYGKTPKIEFAHGSANITVIHGMNGAGKTAFLNAFTWILYGTFSKGFRNPQQLINKRALAEAKLNERVECVGELAFLHEGRCYWVRKSVEAVVDPELQYQIIRDKDLLLRYQDTDGQWKRVSDIESTIGKILPRDLHSYFFFDGERVEKIVDPGKDERADLAKAVKTILSLEPLERTIRHLSIARKHFEEEIGKYGDAETKELVAKKEALEAQIEQMELDATSLEQRSEAQSDIVRNITERIGKLEAVSHLISQQSRLQETIAARKLAMGQNTEGLRSLISDRGYGVFTAGIQKTFSELIRDLKSRGEIPIGIKTEFVNRLLTEKTCICGRSIDPASGGNCLDAHNSVRRWLNSAGLQQIEDRALELGARVATWNHVRSQLQERLKEIHSRARVDLAEMDRANAEHSKISKLLEGSPMEEVSSLQKRRQKEESLNNEYRDALRDKKRDLQAREEELKELEKSLDRLKTQNAKQELAKKRRDVAEEIISATREVLKLMDTKWRLSLEKRIRETFRSISVKPYIPQLGKDYSIVLIDPNGGGEVAFSQGESLVLSFSFISAIIEEARKLASQQGKLFGPESSEYPLIMDSPFGALDDTNRTRVATTIGQLADQVIALVSKTQWREEVEDAMRGRTGKSYVLTYYCPREDTVPSEIRLQERAYPLIKRSANGHEYTEIREVSDV